VTPLDDPAPVRTRPAGRGTLPCALALLAAGWACTGHPPPADEPTPTVEPPDAAEATVEPPVETPWTACPAGGGVTAVPRAELQAFLDRGLPDLLGRVRTAPVLDRQGAGARFLGFRLVALDPDLRCAAFALREGDVLTSVNGRGIERPEDALEVWNGLFEATVITLSLIRGGLPVDVELLITDEPVRIDNDGVAPNGPP
jgi:hypothetical protein